MSGSDDCEFALCHSSIYGPNKFSPGRAGGGVKTGKFSAEK
ncbi:Hypothetical protein ABZS17I87_03988 [Kosakonia cowanii]